MFGRKTVKTNMDFEIVLAKLSLLSTSLVDGTDRPSDLKFWEENIKILNEITPKKQDYLYYLKENYNVLFKVYLMKYYAENVNDYSVN